MHPPFDLSKNYLESDNHSSIFAENICYHAEKGVVIMGDIQQTTQRNLKNIQQIGSTDEEDKIYIEKSAYDRIHREELQDKRVFVLMGHTECTGGRYATFVEAAIPVVDIEFVQNIPRWNNHSWSEVFRDIKRTYESYIIVGWALDIKGMPPKISMELEAVHREQFGGAHQILFLLDSMERDEFFYITCKNHLRQKQGFYIYYEPEYVRRVDVELETLDRHERENASDWRISDHIPDWRVDNEETTQERRTEKREKPQTREREKPKYRQMLKESEKKPEQRQSVSYVMSAAVVLLIGIIGVGAYRTRNQMYDLQHAINTISFQKQDTEEAVKQQPETENRDNTDTSTQENTETKSTETMSIPVDEVPGIEQKEVSGDAALAKPSEEPVSYCVQKGDTLRSICRERYGNLDRISEICSLNGISDPDAIYDGQILKMPQ